jgi:hypothetical protein
MGLYDGSRIYRDGPGLVETTVVLDADWHDERPTLRFWHPRYGVPRSPVDTSVDWKSIWARVDSRSQ